MPSWIPVSELKKNCQTQGIQENYRKDKLERSSAVWNVLDDQLKKLKLLKKH